MKKRRSDARDNRARIVSAARDALALEPEASFHAIARAANVGQATLYRHFPRRRDLVAAVYRENIEAVVQRASFLLEQHPPLEAFRSWCEEFVEYGRKKRVIAGMVSQAVSDHRELHAQLVDAVRNMIEICAHAGHISKSIDAEDVLQILPLFMQFPHTEEGTSRGQRLLRLVFKGIATSA